MARPGRVVLAVDRVITLLHRHGIAVALGVAILVVVLGLGRTSNDQVVFVFTVDFGLIVVVQIDFHLVVGVDGTVWLVTCDLKHTRDCRWNKLNWLS